MKKHYLPLILALALLPVTGCTSAGSASQSAQTTSAETSGGYMTLDAALENAINRIDALKKTPGSPDSYKASVQAIADGVTSAADALNSKRESLIATGQKQVQLMRDESAKFTDRELADKLTKRAASVQEAYAKFTQASAGVTDPLKQVPAYAEDIKRILAITNSDNGVKSTFDTLDKIKDSLKAAKKKIPDAKDALEDLRKELPKQPVATA